MSKKRRRFSTKFKAKVALEAAKEIKTVKQLSSQYELSGSQIAKWKIQLLVGLPNCLKAVAIRKRKGMISPNRLLGLHHLKIDSVNQVWCSDITISL